MKRLCKVLVENSKKSSNSLKYKPNELKCSIIDRKSSKFIAQATAKELSKELCEYANIYLIFIRSFTYLSAIIQLSNLSIWEKSNETIITTNIHNGHAIFSISHLICGTVNSKSSSVVRLSVKFEVEEYGGKIFSIKNILEILKSSKNWKFSIRQLYTSNNNVQIYIIEMITTWKR